MRLSTLLAIGIATTLSAGAAVNPTAQQTASKSMIDYIMRTNAEAGNGTWVPTLEIVKNAEGVPTSKIERKFDDKAQLIEAKSYRIYNGDEESAYPYRVETYAYDEAGHTTLSQEILYRNAETPSSGNKIEYAYDANGNMIKNYYYGLNTSDGKWIERNLYNYAYDSNGRQTMFQNVSNPNQEGKFQYGNKWEQTFDSEGYTTSGTSYSWNVETQKFDVTTKEEQAYRDGNRVLYASYLMIDGELTLTYKESKTYDAKGMQTSLEEMNWNGTELVGQNKWERTSNDNWQETLYATYRWENGKWLPDNKKTTEYGDELTIRTSYYGDGVGDEWIPSFKQETPANGSGNAQYNWDPTAKDWYVTSNNMTIRDANWRYIARYNYFYTWQEIDGVRQYSGTKTEYTYDAIGTQSSTTYTWDNEKQDWTITEMSINVNNISTTGIVENGWVSDDYGYKNTSYYRTGTLMWTAEYTWNAEKQEFVEVSKTEYKYTLDENGNVATREAYRNDELIETTYYFYTEVGTTGIDGVTSAATGAFKVSGNTITFAEATQVAVYTLDGKMVHNGVTESLTLDAGNVYILKGAGWNKKIAL